MVICLECWILNVLFSDGYIINFLDGMYVFLRDSFLLEIHAETSSYEMISSQIGFK